LTLVELMVGLVLGMRVVASAAALLVNHLREHRALLLEARLMRDLRTAADLVVQSDAKLGRKAVQVTLRWFDRHGAAQQLRLATQIAGQDPALAGALTLPRPAIVHPGAAPP
jgi:Tfp pilus assembly protein PilW